MEQDALFHRLTRHGVSHGGYGLLYVPSEVSLLFFATEEFALSSHTMANVFVSRCFGTPGCNKAASVTLMDSASFACYGMTVRRMEDLVTPPGKKLPPLHSRDTFEPRLPPAYVGMQVGVDAAGIMTLRTGRPNQIGTIRPVRLTYWIFSLKPV